MKNISSPNEQLLPLFKEYFLCLDGQIFWKKSTSRKIKIGSRAGFVDKGYRRVKLNGKLYQEHSVVYTLSHGYYPNLIDHINGNKSDNRIENLRPCTSSENNRNRGLHSNNTSGTTGVYKTKNKWYVQIYVNNRNKHLGIFDNKKLAELVSEEARDLYYGKYARINSG